MGYASTVHGERKRNLLPGPTLQGHSFNKARATGTIVVAYPGEMQDTFRASTVKAETEEWLAGARPDASRFRLDWAMLINLLINLCMVLDARTRNAPRVMTALAGVIHDR